MVRATAHDQDDLKTERDGHADHVALRGAAHIPRTPHPRNRAFGRRVRKTQITRIPFAYGAYQSVSWPPLSASARLDKAEVTGSSPVSPTPGACTVARS